MDEFRSFFAPFFRTVEASDRVTKVHCLKQLVIGETVCCCATFAFMVPPNSFFHHPHRHKPTHKKKNSVVLFWMCVLVHMCDIIIFEICWQFPECINSTLSVWKGKFCSASRIMGREIRFSFFAAAATATEPSGIHKYLREWRVCACVGIPRQCNGCKA